MRKEFNIFGDFIRSKGLRHTPQRDRVLELFLSTEGHVSVEELYKKIRRSDPAIGYTTVYRTMKLLKDMGLCDEIDFGDGISRYEHKYNHAHHDHLICMKCGRSIEVVNQKIERLQDELARKKGFAPMSHKLEIFGLCKRCSPHTKKGG